MVLLHIRQDWRSLQSRSRTTAGNHCCCCCCCGCRMPLNCGKSWGHKWHINGRIEIKRCPGMLHSLQNRRNGAKLFCDCQVERETERLRDRGVEIDVKPKANWAGKKTSYRVLCQINLYNHSMCLKSCNALKKL